MPSRNIIILGVMCLLILGTITYTQYGGKILKDNQETPKIETSETVASSTDNALKNEKRDGDSALGAFTNPNSKNSNQSEPELTPTERFSRDFLSSYLEIVKSSGTETLDETQQQNLIESLMQKDYVANFTYKKYTTSDLSIVLSSKFDLHKYGNTLEETMVKNTINGSEYEVNVFSRYLKSQNESDLKKLDLNIQEYEGNIRDFLKIPVDYAVSAIHLHIINAFSKVLSAIKEMKIINSDPIASINVLNDYSTSVEDLKKALLELKSYMAKNKISFSQNEYGSLLFKGL